MRKVPKTSAVLDLAHKGFVSTCIAVTVVGFAVLGYRGYHYFTKVKPQLHQQRMSENQSLLTEGSSTSIEDSAPSLKV